MTESAYGGLFTVGPEEEYTTISSALARMQDGDSCIVKEGVYRECIRVPQNRITLRGEGRVVVTGCDEAGSPTDAVVNGHKCVVFDVGKPVYEVFCGDWYLSMARFPNKTEPMTSNEDWAFATIEDNGDVTFTEPDLAVPLNLEDGYYVGVGRFNAFYSLTLPILGLRENGSIRINGDKASSGYLGQYNRKGIGYIIGARAALDTPGEWYTAGTQLWLIPPHNDPGRYEFRTRLYGVVVTGNGVALENIRFRAAAGRIEGNDVTLKKCTFEYISPFRHTPHPADAPEGRMGGQSMACCWGLPENGTAGVFVSGDGFVAEDCRFSKSWWCGMMLRGNKARIENCLFEDVNWMAKRCAGLFCWGDDNVVRYCTFRDLGGAGIEGGNRSWVKQYAKRNIWEYNYIEGICKLIVDQGFFYVNHQSGNNPRANSIWRYNVGKGGYGPNKGKWTNTVAGYYVDNNSSGYRIHNNIAINVKQGIKYNDFRDGEQAGKDVWYYNNTLYNCLSLGIEPQGNPDADLNLVNNLAILPGMLRFSENLTRAYGWQNNLDSVPSDAVRDPDAMDFTPTRKDLKEGGIPVMDTAMPYIGAVDPAKGMWRYGADESKLQTR